MNDKRIILIKILQSSIGPVLSLIAFVMTYYLDPLNFEEHQAFAALPAFLLSIVILQIAHNIDTSREIRKGNSHSDRIYEAVKDYLHVTSLGSPEKAMEYIINRLPALKEVKNTSFNLENEQERADEKFYDTDTYNSAMNKIAYYAAKKTIWKDIGDRMAVDRLRLIHDNSQRYSKGKSNYYKYKLILNNEPQLNFIILEFKDDNREVLFNWDFRGIGQDPTVLISRDNKIIDMFSIHYAHLWKRASLDHDNIDTKSTSKK